MPRAAILGTGLIGASLGLALRGQGWTVVGWDPSAAAVHAATERDAIDVVASGPDAAIAHAELVVLAGPPAAIVAGLRSLRTDALVTDVAGVKVPVVDAGAHLPRFVGGHPMAGRERAGAAAASAALFRGAAWVLTPDGARPDDVEAMSEIVRSVGARPVVLPAAEHDQAVAFVSHLPQVIASELVRLVAADDAAFGLAAGSFRDLTRVALSEPAWWAELLTVNREAVVDAIGRLRGRLGDIEHLVATEDVAVLGDRLAEARRARRAMAPPVVAVRVALADRPGELAAVGRALATSGVDVRDLQLRHGPHGGGGVLTLSVRPGEAEALRDALAAEGFTPEV